MNTSVCGGKAGAAGGETDAGCEAAMPTVVTIAVATAQRNLLILYHSLMASYSAATK
jgi:hypothetical protein